VPTLLIRQLPANVTASVIALAMLAGMLTIPSAALAQIPNPANGRLGRNPLGRNSVPSVAYFRAIEQLYEGDYRRAERTFRREVKSAIKIGVTDRWLDSIAYHAMYGETFYQQGRLVEALQQFDRACLLFLQNPNWMIRVNFKREPQVDTNRLRRILPWGQSTRQFTLGRFPTQELIRIGDLGRANQTARTGGRLQLPQLWKLNIIEIVRATSLAIRRRNELLGPLGTQDVISRELVTALSRSSTIPNHWSKGWADLQLGLAQVGVGDTRQAERYFQKRGFES